MTRPLTTELVGRDGELRTTAVVETDRVVRIAFKAFHVARGVEYDLGGCEVVVLDPRDLQATWDRTSYYIKSHAERIIHEAQSGRGHRLQPEIFYNLFSRTVDYQTENFKCIREAYVSADFDEAVAKVILHAHPPESRFTVSPYWGEGLAHLAGFIVNHQPSRPGVKTTTFMFESAESFQRSTEFEAGKVYLTYARVLSREGDRAVCEIVVFDDADRVVMQYAGVRFHQVQNAVIDALSPSISRSKSHIGGPDPGSTQRRLTRKAVPQVTNEKAGANGVIQTPSVPPGRSSSFHVGKEPDALDGISNKMVIQCLLESIAQETGSDVADLTDDITLTEIGVDSIMAIEVVATVKAKSGCDVPPNLLLGHPTIGHLRRQFDTAKEESRLQWESESRYPQPKEPAEGRAISTASQETARPSTSSTSSSSIVVDPPMKSKASPSFAAPSAPAITVRSPPPARSPAGPEQVATPRPVGDTSPLPKAKIVLMQGRPKPNEPRLYLIADGCGTVSNYIALVAHQFSVPIYGMDSAFLRCPSRLTPDVGIAGVARYLVDALLAHGPSAPVLLGGYSGGATLAYEVARQLAEVGRRVDGLLLIDMRCPLPPPPPPSSSTDAETEHILPRELVWKLTQHAFALDSNSWDSEAKTSQHLGRLFECVATYHPEPLPEEFHCRTAIVWCAKGMIGRLEKYPELMEAVMKHELPTEAYPGYSKSPAILGTISYPVYLVME